MSMQTEHMRLEEEVYFPKLAACMSIDEQHKLYEHLVSAKAMAPSSTHTMRPDKPMLARVRSTHVADNLLVSPFPYR